MADVSIVNSFVMTDLVLVYDFGAQAIFDEAVTGRPRPVDPTAKHHAGRPDYASRFAWVPQPQ